MNMSDMGGKIKGQLLTHTSYPLYSCAVISDRHLILAGGGGEAKTGVPNRIDVFYLDSNLESNEIKANKIISYDTDRQATMNFDVAVCRASTSGSDGDNFILACGQSNCCVLFSISLDLARMINGSVECVEEFMNPSHRKKIEKEKSKAPINGKYKIGLKMNFLKSFITDFDHNDAYQKVVRVDPIAGKFVITGGADGHFRIWDVFSGKKIVDHNAHKGEIMDISISTDAKYFVSLGKDNNALCWSVADGKKISQLKIDNFLPGKLRYRAVRFTPLGKLGPIFLTALVPSQRAGKGRGQCSYVCQWVLLKVGCRPIHAKSIQKENISTMAVNETGKFCVLGTQEGSVVVLDSLNLNILKYIPETHGIFVTGVSFLPLGFESSPLSNLSIKNQCGVISISADNTVQVHLVERRSKKPFVLKLSYWFLISFFILVILAFFGL